MATCQTTQRFESHRFCEASLDEMHGVTHCYERQSKNDYLWLITLWFSFMLLDQMIIYIKRLPIIAYYQDRTERGKYFKH